MDSTAKLRSILTKAVELDPKLAEAHEWMADLALTNDDTDLAVAEADKAIALENDALDAMAIHAAVELIADRSPDAWLAKIQAINPGYGQAYANVARQLELHYRYEDAVTYYRKAIEVEPRLWAAHSELGIDLMRLGKQEEPCQGIGTELQQWLYRSADSQQLKLAGQL